MHNVSPPKDPSKVFMIECLEPPSHREKGEGDYEFRWGDKPDEVMYHDIMSLRKELTSLIPERTEDLMDYLQNFRVAYVNLDTGEIFS